MKQSLTTAEDIERQDVVTIHALVLWTPNSNVSHAKWQLINWYGDASAKYSNVRQLHLDGNEPETAGWITNDQPDRKPQSKQMETAMNTNNYHQSINWNCQIKRAGFD